MKNTAVSLIAVLAALVNIATVHGGEEMSMVKKECNTRVQRNLKRLVKEFGECNREMKKELNLNSEEHAKRMGCAIKCVMMKENFLTPEGKVTEDIMKNAIEKEGIPLFEYQDKVMSLFVECKNKFGDKVDPQEEYCKSYMEFGNCLHQVIAEFCEEHVDKVDWQ